MAGRGLRDLINLISPPWKRTGVFEKYDYAVALVLDAILDKVNQGVLARIPTQTLTTTSLPLIGADRLIPQGFSESTAAYKIRLQRAFDDWFHAGSARAVLSQVLGYLTPYAPFMRTVNSLSAWDDFVIGSSPSDIPEHLPSDANVSPTANWDWDSLNETAQAWIWRTWLIIDSISPNAWITSTMTWTNSGKKWGDTTISWGFDSPSAVIKSIRSLVKLWKDNGAWCQWIIINFNAGDFDPGEGPGSPVLPDGNWGHWSKIESAGGTLHRVPARFSTARYADGTI